MKTLLAMRHAKSDWDAPYRHDHDRPLSERGVAAARFMGRLVADRDLVPDLVISSTAVRARTTAELAIEAGEWGSQLRLEPGLYGTSVEGALEVAASSPDVPRLMLVGHQPTWGGLVARLTGEVVEVKTATVAVTTLPIESWTEVTGARGTLTGLHHPPRGE